MATYLVLMTFLLFVSLVSPQFLTTNGIRDAFDPSADDDSILNQGDTGVKDLDPLEGYKLEDSSVSADPDSEEDLRTDVIHKLPSRTVILDSMSAPYFQYPEPGNPYRFLFSNDATIIQQKVLKKVMMDNRVFIAILLSCWSLSSLGQNSVVSEGDKPSDGPLSQKVVVLHQNMNPIPVECYSPPDSGSCVKDMVRVYYNHEIRQCSTFSYTGCGGNANRFLSVKNCYRICHPFKYEAKLPTGKHPIGLPAPVGGSTIPPKIMYPVKTVQNVPVVKNVKVVKKGYVSIQP